MSGPVPYWADETCALYLGDCREILPALGVKADCIIADPPYESTSLAWDKWPEGWLEAAAAVSNSMWCFLPMRQFAEPPYRGIEFRAAGWRMSQDAVWEKHNGSGFAADRLKCVHETMTHWYRGRWGDVYHETPRVHVGVDPRSRLKAKTAIRSSDAHHGQIGAIQWTDDGTRMSVRHHRCTGRDPPPHPDARSLLAPLIEYACPPGGLVVAPFAGAART